MSLNDGRFALKVVPISHNRKVGAMAATYRPVGDTCPSTCFLLDAGCYAQKGNVNIHQNRSADDFHELDRALSGGTGYVRHHVSGDFFKGDKLDTEYLDYVISWHRANPSVHGYAYTHRILDIIEAGYTADTLPTNLVLMASLNPEQYHDETVLNAIHAAGYRYTRIADNERDALLSKRSHEAVCPEQLARPRANLNITCLSCKLCTHAKTDVVFIRH